MKQRYPSQAQKEVRWLIEQSGVTAKVTRPQASGEGSFFGGSETSDVEVGTVPLEM